MFKSFELCHVVDEACFIFLLIEEHIRYISVVLFESNYIYYIPHLTYSADTKLFKF